MLKSGELIVGMARTVVVFLMFDLLDSCCGIGKAYNPNEQTKL